MSYSKRLSWNQPWKTFALPHCLSKQGIWREVPNCNLNGKQFFVVVRERLNDDTKTLVAMMWYRAEK